jgi:hypothetical protein
MSKIVRLLLSCCLGLFISAVFFVGRMWHSGTHKTNVPMRSIIQGGDTVKDAHVVRRTGKNQANNSLADN